MKINDGIVMAADSAGSMITGQVYTHANKVADLCEGFPVGAMSTGSAGIAPFVQILLASRSVSAAIQWSSAR